MSTNGSYPAAPHEKIINVEQRFEKKIQLVLTALLLIGRYDCLIQSWKQKV